MRIGKKELRLYPSQLSRLRESDLDGYDSLGVGHPSCVHKMAGLSEASIEGALRWGKEVHLEIPLLFETHFDEWMEKIEAWLQYPVGLVIHDWGTLSVVSQMPLGLDRKLTLGRNLAYSFYNCPWHEDLLSEETELIRQQWGELNLDNEAMAEAMRRYGVSAVDVDLSPELEASLARLRGEGFQVNGFTEAPLASTSRTCHALRHFKGTRGQCQHLCEEPILLEPKQRWNRFDDSLIRIAKPSRDALGRLHVFGNTIVRKLEEPAQIGYDIDVLCIDARFSATSIFWEVEPC
ncbi:hypothetical protein ACFQZE_11430 [Paenibacillus sp. GCM10027627]|uniref:hypothetical protein n=1 Tax=unclassified Paenibacillus TaxID=185978 RepID=UPI00362DE4D4